MEITGMGVITPVAIGVETFSDALRNGITNYSIITFEREDDVFRFPVGKRGDFDLKQEVGKLMLPDELITKAKRLRNVSVSTSFGIYCALEAWADSGLSDNGTDLARVAIISGGTNTQQAMLYEEQEKYRAGLQFLNPNYSLNFFDSDVVGVLSELLSIRGEGFSVGAASASGNMAIIQGHRLLSGGEYDVVLIIAPLMDISIYEFQGFTAMGAMAGIGRYSTAAEICRPFDTDHSGFVYGQSAGCLVAESREHAARRGRSSYGRIAGYGVNMDASRGPMPSVEGELMAILSAIKGAGIDKKEIDYVNTHGSASRIGDETEVSALLSAGLKGVRANSTKSLTGHGLSVAGVVECIASLIQMRDDFLHPGHNLVNPITDQIDWIQGEARIAAVNCTLSNSFGFGGINTSIVITKK